MSTPVRLVALAVVLLTAGACASSGDAPAATPTGPVATAPGTPAPGPSGSASPTASTGGGGALPADLRQRPEVAAAIADTATRAKVDPAEVVVAAWSPVTWNDGSLGCPQKGKSYTQSLVDGELLLLRTDSALFQYNAPAGGPFVYCANPSANYTVGG